MFAGGKGQINVWKSDTGIQKSMSTIKNKLQFDYCPAALVSYLGTLQHVYTELPFTSAICAMDFHPTEHMLTVSSFGSHQPLVVLTQVSRKEESEPRKGTTADSATDERESEARLGQNSMILHLNQRLREVTKTLNRSLTSETTNGRPKVRKKKI